MGVGNARGKTSRDAAGRKHGRNEMKEVKPPQRSMLYYGLMVILTMMIINAFIMPYFQRASIEAAA